MYFNMQILRPNYTWRHDDLGRYLLINTESSWKQNDVGNKLFVNIYQYKTVHTDCKYVANTLWYTTVALVT